MLQKLNFIQNIEQEILEKPSHKVLEEKKKPKTVQTAPPKQLEVDHKK